VPQQRIVVQQLEDVHHRLDRHPHGDWRICPRLRRQPPRPEVWKRCCP
jgi:hypothetical protein